MTNTTGATAPQRATRISADVRLEEWRDRARDLEAQIATVIVGQLRVIRLLNVAVFCRGHVLLEGDVGVGKTTILRAFSRVLGGGFERVEGTVDLMPADLIYSTYVDSNGKPRIEPGPLIRQGSSLSTFFFNEINRARPQVHALLLRAMAERSVRAFDRDFHFPHLQVFADRNRVEREETFEIPSAARDRFLMEIAVEIPEDGQTRQNLMFEPRFHDVDALVDAVTPELVAFEELNAVAQAIQESVSASPALRQYALALAEATREPAAHGVELDGVDVRDLILAGASPRGMSMMLRAARVVAWLAGREHLIPADLHSIFAETVAHRLCFTPVYELRRTELSHRLVAEILRRVPAP